MSNPSDATGAVVQDGAGPSGVDRVAGVAACVESGCERPRWPDDDLCRVHRAAALLAERDRLARERCRLEREKREAEKAAAALPRPRRRRAPKPFRSTLTPDQRARQLAGIRATLPGRALDPETIAAVEEGRRRVG